MVNVESYENSCHPIIQIPITIVKQIRKRMSKIQSLALRGKTFRRLIGVRTEKILFVTGILVPISR